MKKLIIAAIFTMLFAGCAKDPKSEAMLDEVHAEMHQAAVTLLWDDLEYFNLASDQPFFVTEEKGYWVYSMYITLTNRKDSNTLPKEVMIQAFYDRDTGLFQGAEIIPAGEG